MTPRPDSGNGEIAGTSFGRRLDQAYHGRYRRLPTFQREELLLRAGPPPGGPIDLQCEFVAGVKREEGRDNDIASADMHHRARQVLVETPDDLVAFGHV